MEANDCHKNNLDWYDVTDEASARHHQVVEVCTKVGCDEDCDRTRVYDLSIPKRVSV